MDNFFALFNLPQTFALNGEDLAARYRRLQAAAHPDTATAASAAERRAALEMSARINEAYQTLRTPIRRAAYLLELHGVNPFDEQNTAMAPAFLALQMERRESLENARGDADALSALAADADSECAARAGALADLLDTRRDYSQAAIAVRELQYLEKLSASIKAAREELEA